jgi:hypothetical protein
LGRSWLLEEGKWDWSDDISTRERPQQQIEIAFPTGGKVQITMKNLPKCKRGDREH